MTRHMSTALDEEVLEDIIKTVWTELCGNLNEMTYPVPGEGCTSLPRVKPG